MPQLVTLHRRAEYDPLLNTSKENIHFTPFQFCLLEPEVVKSRSLLNLLIKKRKFRQRLEGRQYRNLKEGQDYFKKLICLYDGIKLRSNDQAYINWLREDEQRKFFNLQSTYCYKGETELRLKGRYLNIEIVISYEGKWVVDFSGSVHKLFNILVGNGSHNHNDFSWSDFLQVFDAMVHVFNFNPENLRVVNLEVGVNCILSDYFKLSIAELLDSTLSLWGVCKNKSSIKKSDRNSFSVEKGERYLKMYDKSLQHSLGTRVLRLELGYQRARHINSQGRVQFFSELTKLSSLIAFKYQLNEAFQTILTYNPDLKHLPVEEIEANREVLEYCKSSFWCSQKKLLSQYKYNQKRENLERLTDRYCAHSLSANLRKMITDKLKWP